MQEDSLGTEYQYRFLELLQEFNPKSVFLSVHHSWKGGMHIQGRRRSYKTEFEQLAKIIRMQG
jgi:hypothetical protein